MDRLQGDDLKLACKVIHERYKTCVKQSFVDDVIKTLDTTGPNKKCSALFADLTDYCTEYLRSGELQTGKQDKNMNTTNGNKK